MRGKRTLRGLFAAAGMLAVALPIVTPAASGGTTRPDQFLFVSSGGKVERLRLATIGGGVQTVYEAPRSDNIWHRYSWSPDGSRFAFSVLDCHSRTCPWSVSLMKGDPDAGWVKKVRVTPGNERGPQWSSTNKIFMWDTFSSVILTRPDGRIIKQAYTNYPGDMPIDWSPDGKRFLMTYEFCHHWDTECAEPTLFYRTFGNAGSVNVGEADNGAFSPDGRSIAYTGNGLKIYSLDTGEPTSVGFGGGTPTWSPDGTRIAVTGPGGLWAVAVDGEDDIQLTHNPSDHSPRWSPSGDWVSFLRATDDGRRDIFVVDATGNDEQLVIATPKYEWAAAWRPLVD